jgi:hypothetical protein
MASRFRPIYRELTVAENDLITKIKNKAEELEGLFHEIKPGRYPALATTALEEAVMWAVKGATE